MADNYFDKYDDQPTPPVPQGANPFDKYDPPEVQADRAQAAKPPVTATNRVHAAEGGIFGGAAYLAASPLDAVANPRAVAPIPPPPDRTPGTTLAAVAR